MGEGPRGRSRRVLMVCMGNICRSPTAEAMLRLLVEEAGLAGRVEVDSAGTHDYHVGEPPDHRAQLHGLRHGLDLAPLRARQVEQADLDRFDHVLAMDEDNLEGLKALARRQRGAMRARIGLLLEFAPRGTPREVPDPYYGGPDGFEEVIALVRSGCEGLLERLREELRDAPARGGPATPA